MGQQGQAAGPGSRKGDIRAKAVGQWQASGHGTAPSETGMSHASRAFQKHLSMIEDGLVLLDLCRSLWIRAQWATVQGQSPMMPTGVLAFAVASVGNESGYCSVTDLCYTSYWPRKFTSHCWPPWREICWNHPVLGAVFSELWVFQTDETDLHILLAYQVHYPRVAHQGVDFRYFSCKIPWLQDIYVKFCLCQLYYVFFSFLPYPITKTDVCASEQWVGLFSPTALLL